MEKAFSQNYIKIYFWKILRIVSGILSMMIIIPYISSDKDIYGIYVICTSLTILLQYSDIGFMDAGLKYASEFVAKKDMSSEIRILSFVNFIMFILIMVFIISMIILAYHPNLLINNLLNENHQIAKHLLLILALSSPIILLQRFCQSIFTIRIQDYIYHQIDLVFNILKIGAVFFFFRSGHYEITQYYFFIQVLNLLAVIVFIYVIKRLFLYDFKLVIQSFKFSRAMFEKTKKLAYSSMFMTISWILFFQMDALLIAKFFNSSTTAIYSIGLYFLTFSSSIINTIYYPFLIRFNHFISENDNDRLFDVFYRLIKLAVPLFIIPTIAVIFLLRPLIFSWVGVKYVDSVLIAQILMTSIFWIILSTPITNLLIAKEKFKYMYISGAILPVVFFISIFIMMNHLGVLSFAIAKSLALFINSLFLILFSLKIFPKSILVHFFKLFPRMIISVIILLSFLYFLRSYWYSPLPKNLFWTIRIIVVAFLSIGTSLVFYYFQDKFCRSIFFGFFKSLDKNKMRS